MSSTKETFREYMLSSFRTQMSFQSYLVQRPYDSFISQEQHEAARRQLGFPVKR